MIVKVAKGKSNGANLLGSWSFLIGVVLAVLLGLGFTGGYQGTILWVVFLLGIIVGLLNIAVDEAAGFLTSGTVLVLVSYLGASVLNGVAATGVVGVTQLVGVLNGILTLFVPATIIVALRAVFVLAKN